MLAGSVSSKNSARVERAFLPVVSWLTHAAIQAGRAGDLPNYASVCQPSSRTEFENEVRRLGLDEHNYVGSDQLRQWCEHDRNRVYVPESLLKHWRIDVDPNVC